MDLIANLCKNVIVLNDGQILMQGTMEQVRNDERVIDAYFGGGVI
jgi:branched-chain amino acid transport system ATP-binding protein